MSEFSIYRSSFQHAKLDRKENGVLEGLALEGLSAALTTSGA
jgi:hypothetical protein